jgi:hypothetical protein
MSHKIFTNFVEILKLLQVFEVLVKKIPINYKIYSKYTQNHYMCKSQ